jgi:SAM-dependent methyltransferase
VFVELPDVPVLCNVLYDTREEATRVPRGDLTLAYAPKAGHVFNTAFNPAKITYSQAYENSLHFSPRFRDYAKSLADRLIETYDVRGKTVVDIGCGKGDFLQLLCERGDNRGIGYDPSYEPGPDEGDRPFEVVQDLYSEAYADHPADLVCCLHVLEHVSDPLAFAQTIRRAVGDRPDTVVYVEVPNALFTLRDLAIWDLIYEHYSYFTPSSLTYLFRRAGFEVLRVGEAFNGQYLQIELRPGEPEDAPLLSGDLHPARVTETVEQFVDRYREKHGAWRDLFARVEGDDTTAVLWGAGSKGVTILNVVPGASRAVRAVVDINPRKQGQFIPGAGQQIVSPSDLTELQPDLVVMMNGIYEDEIRRTVADLGLAPEFVVAS